MYKKNFDSYRNNLLLLLLILVSVIGFTLLSSAFGPAFVWNLFGVRHMDPLFLDLYSVTTAAEVYSQGGNPYEDNYLDPGGRNFPYPRIWLLLSFIGVNSTVTNFFALLLVAGYLAAAVIIPRNKSISTEVALYLALISPASLLCINRGNVDLLIFSLIVLALYFWEKGKSGVSVAFVVLGAILKYFPVFSVMYFFTNTKLAVKSILIVSAVFLTYLVLSSSSMSYTTASIQTGIKGSYGVSVMSSILEMLGFGGVVQLFPYFLLVLIGVIVYRLRTVAIFPSCQGRSVAPFLAGSGVYCGTFLLGANWDYRLIFLVLCLPLLMDQLNGPKKVLPMVTVGSIFLSMWGSGLSFYLRDSQLLGLLFVGLDEAVNWVLFFLLLALGSHCLRMQPILRFYNGSVAKTGGSPSKRSL